VQREITLAAADYALDPKLVEAISPASKLMTTSTSIARHNFVYDWTVGGRGPVPLFG
jgi:hypothetical protein